MLKKLKVSYKLTVLSAILLLFIGVIGFTGYYFNQKANVDMTRMYKEQLEPSQWLGDIRAHTRANEGNMLYAILNSENPTAVKKYNDDIEKRLKTVDEDLKKYKASYLTPFEEEQIVILEKQLKSFIDLKDNIISLARSGKAQEALDLLHSQESIVSDLQSTARGLAEYQQKLAEGSNLQNDKDFKVTKYIIIAGIIAALIAGIILSILITRSIVNPLRHLEQELNILVEKGGDLTKEIQISTKDEIGNVGKATNKFLANIRAIISGIIVESGNMEHTIDIVNEKMTKMNSNIEEISATTEELSAGMEETAASTEEMNSTSVEIEQAIESIASKAQEGAKAAGEISIRASELKASAIASQKTASDVYSMTNEKLRKAIEDSKAVEKISVLSSAILDITEQTNLLALNAAIEAARAGEAGRGFSVVSDEIRKLADVSKTTANEIQNIAKTVISSVDNLSESAERVLDFIDKQVIKDYEMLVNTGEQYSNDADTVDNLVTDFSATSQQLLASIQNVMVAINEITTATNEGATGATNIASNTTNVAEEGTHLIEQANTMQNISKRLVELVKKFRV